MKLHDGDFGKLMKKNIVSSVCYSILRILILIRIKGLFQAKEEEETGPAYEVKVVQIYYVQSVIPSTVFEEIPQIFMTRESSNTNL